MQVIQKHETMYPDLKEQYGKIGNLFSKKLYHELLLALEVFMADEKCNKKTNFIELYHDLIKNVQDKFNQLKFISLCGVIAEQYADKTQAISFLEGLLSDEKRKAVYGPDATLLCTFLLAKTKLEVSYEKYGDEVKKMLEEKKEQVEGLVGAEPIVHASYYIVACNYYQEIGPAELFYKNALMYLAYSPYENMKQKDRADLAVNISLAALAGDGIFNFGQVLVTPILKALTGTEKEWLADLLNAFNKGDIEQFNTIMSKKQSEFDAQPALANKKQFIKEKIALMALMDLVFHRPAHDRTLTFEEIAIRTCLPLEQIEWLLMRAMSLKLIEGIIDQVDGNVSISYIQSRVLDKSQMTELKDRLSEWSTKVKDILLFVEEQTPELFE